MATKIFGVTPNQPLGSSAATPTSFLFYEGYQELANKTVNIAGSSSATPISLGTNAPFVNVGDTILIADYRSKASFSNDFLNIAPDANSATRIYNVLLNRDSNSTDPSASSFATNNALIDSILSNSEYQANKSSLFEYPILIYNQNGNLVWQSNDYAAYVNRYPGLIAINGQNHYQQYGRGEGRTFAKIDVPDDEYFVLKTPSIQSTFGMMRIKDTFNWFRPDGSISVKNIVDFIDAQNNTTTNQNNISVNELFNNMINSGFTPEIGKSLSPPNQFSELRSMYAGQNYAPTITLNGQSSIKILINNYNNS